MDGRPWRSRQDRTRLTGRLVRPPGPARALRIGHVCSPSAQPQSLSHGLSGWRVVTISPATVLRTAASVVLGAVVGAIVAVSTPAHLEIAGSDAAVRIHLGRAYDQIVLSSGVLVGTQATSRSVLGEHVGISVNLDLDPSTFVAADG